MTNDCKLYRYFDGITTPETTLIYSHRHSRGYSVNGVRFCNYGPRTCVVIVSEYSSSFNKNTIIIIIIITNYVKSFFSGVQVGLEIYYGNVYYYNSSKYGWSNNTMAKAAQLAYSPTEMETDLIWNVFFITNYILKSPRYNVNQYVRYYLWNWFGCFF